MAKHDSIYRGPALKRGRQALPQPNRRQLDPVVNYYREVCAQHAQNYRLQGIPFWNIGSQPALKVEIRAGHIGQA